jgi:hypothetical protein
MRRDVVHVRVQLFMALMVGPLNELLAASDPAAVIVDRVLVEDGSQKRVVVTIERAGVPINAVEDLLAVDEVLELLR